MWKAWLTLNQIPTMQVVRDQRIKVDQDITVVEFATDKDGQRIVHTCECDNGGHLAKQVTHYKLLEQPGRWALVDVVGV